MRQFIFTISLLLSFILGNSQVAKQERMIWSAYQNQIKLNEKWYINSDFQFRTKEWLKTPMQMAIRAGVQKKLNTNLSFASGYAHFRFFTSNLKTRGEHRIWEEITNNQIFNKLKTNERIRIEQRFIEFTNVKNNKKENNFNWRFRFKLDLSYPITKIKSSQLNIIIGNEVMLNAGKIIEYNAFDQNRLYSGLLLELTEKIQLQLLYMKLIQSSNNSTFLNKTNVIRVNFNHTIEHANGNAK